LVALKLSYMAHPWPLMIQTIKRSISTAFFGTRSLVISQGTDSTGFAVKSLLASLHLAVCPSAACSPPLTSKVTLARFQSHVKHSSYRCHLLGHKITAQCSPANPGSCCAAFNQIHGKGKRAQTHFHFAPQPNLAFNRDADTGHRFGNAMRAPVNLGVRLSFFEGHFMARLWSLKLQRIERLSMLRLPVMRHLQTSRHATGRFSGTHALVNFQGPALISSAVRNVVAWQVANGLSALRQPAHLNAAPKCHTPSACWPPVLRQPTNQSVSPSPFMPPPGGPPALRRPALQIGSSQPLARQAESLAIRAKGSLAMQRPNINEHSTAGLLASPVASRPSLTGRSTGTSMLRIAAR
jgi:hypothetical protein